MPEQQPPRGRHPLRGHRHHQGRYTGGAGQGAQGVDEKRRAGEAEILLGQPRAHAGAGTARGDHDHGLPQCTDSSAGAGRAKIIRPAVVCSTLVTVTSSIWPMCFLPWSTTTMVPSSRYATPCPASLPSFMTCRCITSPGSTTGLIALASSLMLSTGTPDSSATLLRL